MTYIDLNRKAWEQRTPVHLKSDFYDVQAFINGASSLNDLELRLLGNVEGKSILHLQCHFGQDSLSLARLGAQVTGVDFSAKAIEAARKLNRELHFDAQFIECDLYSLPQHLDRQFDVVYTSYGTIGWLPDIHRWAEIVHRYLAPGGRFVFVEFHPVVWMFASDFERIEYRYFNSDPIEETETGTYADPSAAMETVSMTWNHGLAEVLQALLSNGLVLQHIAEYDYSPYNCFRHTEKIADKKFRIKPLGDKIPMLYSLVLQK